MQLLIEFIEFKLVAEFAEEMPPKTKNSYQRQLAVLKTRVPKRPEEEVGKEI